MGRQYFTELWSFYANNIDVLLFLPFVGIAVILFIFGKKDDKLLKFFLLPSLGQRLDRSLEWCRNLSDSVFGPKLISFRSFSTSFAISLFAFLGFLFLSFPPISKQNLAALASRFDFTPPYSSLDLFILAIIVSLSLDFVSVIETRLVIRALRSQSRVTTVIRFLLLDLLLTLGLFIFLNPLVYIAVTEWPMAMHIVRNFGAITIEPIFPRIEGVPGLEQLNHNAYYLWGLNIFYHYTRNLFLTFVLTAEQLSRWPIPYLETPVLYYFMEESGTIVQRPYFIVPFTVFFFTTFATSIWIIWFAGAASISVLVRKYIHWTRQMLERINPLAGSFIMLQIVFTFQVFILSLLFFTIKFVLFQP